VQQATTEQQIVSSEQAARNGQIQIPAPRRKIFSWTLFDFAHTAFSVMMITFAFPLYFKEIVCKNSESGDAWWGLSVSLSMLIVAIIAPVLGAASDFSRRRKRFLLAFTLTSIACTALMFFVGEGNVAWSIALFVTANVGYEGGIVFYDAYLPEITTPRSYGRVSGYGFAMGYLGALAILAVCFPLLKGGFEAENLLNIRWSFVTTAAFFFVFSVPIFLVFRDNKINFPQKISYVKVGITRSLATLRNLREYPNLARFLVAFFIYNDGILTVISFASIFAKETLKFTVTDLLIFFLVIQTTAILGSIIFGVLADKIGPKKTIIITLVIWIGVIVLGFFTETKSTFYVVGLLAGISIGSSQATSRSLMARLVPKEREAEFFGFYDGFCGKASAIVGPLVFGVISSITGSQRVALLSVLLFFVAGLILFRDVKENG
jgi:UMF1 family MFS transporter